MSRRKLMTGLAALTIAGAIAVPAASASAQAVPGPITPPDFVCNLLASQIQAANTAGLTLVANILGEVSSDIGCSGTSG